MKKVLALVLAATMVLGMSTMSFAADNKITGIASKDALEKSYSRSLGESSYNSMTGNSVSNQTVTYAKSIIPFDKTKDYIDLYRGMFQWKSTPDAGRLSANEIRTSKLAVRTSNSSGSKAVDTISIDSKNGHIEIKYVEEYVATKDLDFDFTVYLTIDGKRHTDAGLSFIGTLANPVTQVYADDDYVDGSYGQVVEAMDFNKDIEVDLGNGISIFTKMFKGKKYYGTSTRDSDEKDSAVFAKYADIDNVVTLKTVGLNSTGDIVQLDTDYSAYYVYDKGLHYLGRSNELLPFSTKYYLANKKIDVVPGDEEEFDDEDPEAPEDEELEDEEGDSGEKKPGTPGAASPNTGTNSFLSVAVVAAAVSLAAVVAVSLRKKK